MDNTRESREYCPIANHEWAIMKRSKNAAPPSTSASPQATVMIRLLVAAQEATARSVFPLVAKADDQPSADLLTQRLEVHEKTAWMLRSLLEE